MRHYPDWIKAFMQYAQIGEAPPYMYFWVGVSTVAGALRRRVWIEQGHFKWLSNFYVILVAPPGIIAKSTTASIGMNLLRQVPGIKFGPDVVTWQALVQSMAQNAEMFEYEGAQYTMSAITIESSEFGTLINPQDREMVDMLVSLWDGKEGVVKKVTKTQGNDEVTNPWVNIIACTTPAWIAGNFPEYMIGGGFTSRCVFVYAEEKHQYVAYPGLVLPSGFRDTQKKLVEDLIAISELAGPYELDGPAVLWGTKWYREHWESRPPNLDNERFGGYLARKQTHIHKLAMVMAASKRNERVILKEDLENASTMVGSLEAAMPMVFNQIGKSEGSKHAEELINYVKVRRKIEFVELFRTMYRLFPDKEQFARVLSSAQGAGYIHIHQDESKRTWVLWKEEAR